MSTTLPLRGHLEFLAKEYLGDFVRRGGASVKFLVTTDASAAGPFHDGLATTAAANGFTYARMDSATTRIYQIDQVFFALARQIDWKALAEAFVRSAYDACSFPATDRPEALRVAAAAGRYEVDQRELYRSLRRHLEGEILRDGAMAHEFRLAMFRLCQATLGAGDVDDAELEAVMDWLHGELRQISRLRSALIYTRIARHNARHLLLSATRWLTRCDQAGLVLDLDIARLAVGRRPPLGERDGLYYSKAQVLDAYEVLRQLVDATDDLTGTLVAISAPVEFLSDPTRGIDSYDALRLRVADEVRDRRRANPFASLVRLEAAE